MVVGRLKPGITRRARAARHDAGVADLTQMFPDFNTGWTSRVVPLREQLTGDVRPALLVLAGAVAFVLLIACANVANLLLARATRAQRELAVRAALGAGTRHGSSASCSPRAWCSRALGGVCGLLLAWWALGFLRAVVAERLPIQRLEMVGIDSTVLLFTLAASLVCGLIFGAVPGADRLGQRASPTRSRKAAAPDRPHEATARGARSSSSRVALALVLLVGAGLLVRSFVRLLDQNPGFDPTRTVTMRLSLPSARYGAEGQRAQFLDALLPAGRCASRRRGRGRHQLSAADRSRRRDVDADRRAAKAAEGPGAGDRRARHHARLSRNDGRAAPQGPALQRAATPPTPRAASSSTRRWRSRHWPGEDPIGKRVRIAWDDARGRSHRRRRRRQARRARRRDPRDDVLAVRAQSVRNDDRHGANDRRCQPDRHVDRRPRARSSIRSWSSPTSRRWTRWSRTPSPSGG